MALLESVGLDVYAETETGIGTFCGKTLYRRVIKPSNLTISNSGSVAYDVSNFGAKAVIKVDAIVKSGDPSTISGRLQDFPTGSCYYNERDNKIHLMQSATGAAIPVIAIILEYTKENL